MPLLYRGVLSHRAHARLNLPALIRKFIAAAAVGSFLLAAYTAWYVLTPLDAARYPAEFQITPGSGLRAAARQIEAGGVALGRWRFELLTRALGRSQDIKAGGYELAAAVNPLELLDKLTRGDMTQAELALIEGWTFRQLRAAIESNTALRGDSRGLSDMQILARLGATEVHPEGLFFPDTYRFSKGSSDFDVLGRAYLTMQQQLRREWEARDPALPYRTSYEALIMASVIEKETGRVADRELVSGTLVNRLRINMRLQIDPTVIYGLGPAFDGNLRKRDLLQDGPYNTYTRAGLPPTPIAIPGLASLRAAMHPAQTQALYYVSRGDGSSQFSSNLDEHNRAVAKYQLKR